jgi:1,4-alpha-glucan branching enzyme
LGVILDVVYNHFGPDGNYLAVFSDDYLVREKENEWGNAINFDGLNSGPVREFATRYKAASQFDSPNRRERSPGSEDGAVA